jgi:CRP/FNR family transcriptional regulator, cyclic AMP receptor protein
MDATALRRIQLFDGLSRKQRKLLAIWADEVDVPAGKVICCKGKTADEFFVIEEGTAKVVRDGQYLDALGPGDFFGEMGLLDDQPRNADVIAETELRVMVLRGPALKELERDAPALARRLRRSVQQRREWLEPVT